MREEQFQIKINPIGAISFKKSGKQEKSTLSGRKIKNINHKTSKYRNPDALANAADELKGITKREYQKIDGSRRIAAHLKLDGSNCSRSFNALVSGIRQLAAGAG